MYVHMLTFLLWYQNTYICNKNHLTGEVLSPIGNIPYLSYIIWHLGVKKRIKLLTHFVRVRSHKSSFFLICEWAYHQSQIKTFAPLVNNCNSLFTTFIMVKEESNQISPSFVCRIPLFSVKFRSSILNLLT